MDYFPIIFMEVIYFHYHFHGILLNKWKVLLFAWNNYLFIKVIMNFI